MDAQGCSTKFKSSTSSDMCFLLYRQEMCGIWIKQEYVSIASTSCITSFYE